MLVVNLLDTGVLDRARDSMTSRNVNVLSLGYRRMVWTVSRTNVEK
jgi:hypothetical protein